MNVLKRCCYRSMGKNPKRTVVTVMGIILATALITGVACLGVSSRASIMAYEKEQNGDYHYCFLGVSQKELGYIRNNQNISRYSLAEELGYAALEEGKNPDKPYLYISALDEAAQSVLSLRLVKGRMPENSGELVIGRHIRSNGLADIDVGDTLSLELGKRISGGHVLGQWNSYVSGEEELEISSRRDYTVVGIVERPAEDVEPRMAPGYSAFTCLEDPAEAETLNVYTSYTPQGLKHAEQVTLGILGVDEELYNRYYEGGTCTEEEKAQMKEAEESVRENYWLLKWERMTFSNSTMNMLYALSAVAILVIIVTGVFCIHNSFLISLTEKMKLYGRLSSVGTTSAQQRKMVHYEALFLGLAGIPLGILCGVGATAVLVKAVGGMVEEALGFPLVFGTSLTAILFAAALSAVTIYFSAAGSAKKASKISPISAIRANDTIKIRRRELRCPKVVETIFGIGEKIAYRNLRRARVKYRTTVVSIVVSVAVFIGMTTFVELVSFASGRYYENIPYQLRVGTYQDYYDSAVAITRLEEVEEAEIARYTVFSADGTRIDYSEDYLQDFQPEAEEMIRIQAIGDEAYERYCRRLGVSVGEAQGKAIVLADYRWEYSSGGKIYNREGDIARLSPGDVICGTGEDEGIEIEVLLQTREKPMCMENTYFNNITLIVSDQWMDSLPASEEGNTINIYIRCSDADSVEEIIRNDMQLTQFTVTNYDAQYRSDRSIRLVMSIFLYGFLVVVALIGITNIFNTITTNMELRAPEFAMLRSVGMTEREFRRMIWLEGLFYGGKALLIGIPLGAAISFCFNQALGTGIVTSFRFPWKGTVCAAAAVVLLLYVIMRYSMGRIKAKNVIETIQNENI